MFSPYYAAARRRAAAAGGGADPEQHAAINVALYGADDRRWTMTERGRRHVERSARSYAVGPSTVRWDGAALVIDIDEVAVPLPRRVRGRVRVHPAGLFPFSTALDAAGRHRWGPIAPVARVEAEFQSPALCWSGHGYLDSNEGDEPIDRPFIEWDWSRAQLADGSTAVVYDLRNRQGADRVLAYRFTPAGAVEPFAAPARCALPRTRWRLDRSTRSDPALPARETQRLEDTPFYARAVLAGGLLGAPVVSVHETLNLTRLVSRPVQWMLPCRMPRRG